LIIAPRSGDKRVFSRPALIYNRFQGGMMEHQVWQAVPGLYHGSIYPYIRKPDVISSNSYILADPGQIIVIDPGGLPEQAAVLAQEISLKRDAQERPIFIYLTHSHLDHCLQLMHSTEIRDAGPIVIISHVKGADALEGKDTRATTADLMGHEITSLVIGGRLFGPAGQNVGHDCVQDKMNLQFMLPETVRSVRAGVDLRCQTVTVPGNTGITCYHTPGHSPDSICIQAGRILFTGDLLFATSPGVAGLHGWDHRELMASIEKALWLLDHAGLEYCCPGHGRILDVGTARQTLRAVQKEAASLGGIPEITPDRARMMAAYAADIMAEVDRLFTIIAGRLMFVSHILEELEECGEADRVRSLIDADSMEGFLVEFNRFSQEFHAGTKREIHVALKAGQITAKMARCFDRGCLADVIDPSFIRRASRLIQDYSLTFRGFEPLSSPVPVLPVGIVREGIHSIHRTPFEDDAIIHADDDETYLRALIARIAHVNPLEGMECAVAGDDALSCLMDRDRFLDLLRSLFERYSLTGVTRLAIQVTGGKGIVRISISSPENHPAIFSETGERFLRRSVMLCGGSIQAGDDGSGGSLMLDFPVS
jgi:glyoxylase-like metal-dependent hydrolase (beta-lactamase superfamily II)